MSVSAVFDARYISPVNIELFIFLRIVWIYCLGLFWGLEGAILQKMLFPWVSITNRFHIFNHEIIPEKQKRYIIWHWQITICSVKQNCVSNWRIWGRNGKILWYFGRNVWVRDSRLKLVRFIQNLWKLVGLIFNLPMTHPIFGGTW